jgi:hypothetical protein
MVIGRWFNMITFDKLPRSGQVALACTTGAIKSFRYADHQFRKEEDRKEFLIEELVTEFLAPQRKFQRAYFDDFHYFANY